MTIKDKVAVVTGASRGGGRGVASELARNGASVYVTVRSLEHQPFDERVTTLRCDHRDDAQVEAAFNDIVRAAGTIDILVNNVWGGYERMVVDGQFTWPRPFWEQPLWRWDAMFGAGVRAHFLASRLAAPHMIARGQGLIVNISHWAAQKRIGNVPYGVS